MPDNLQRRSIRAAETSIQTRADGGKQIVGYAAVFYDGTPETEFEIWEGYVERIAPGAFDRALKEKHDVRGLYNHDSNQILGRTKAGTLTLEVDKRGLKYTIDVPDSPTGNSVVASIERGDVSGSSFQFVPKKTQWTDSEELSIREIMDVDLYDVGPVVFPAYEGTTVGMRSQDVDNLRAEWENHRKSTGDALKSQLASYSRTARLVELQEQE